MKQIYICALTLFACILAQSITAQPDPNKTLEIAISGGYQPLATTDANGELVGFDVDIAKAVAERMGYKFKLRQTGWSGIQAALQSGKCDLICSSMAITPERQKGMLFSFPYYNTGGQLFVKHDLERIDGARIGVAEGTTYADFLRDHPKRFPDTEVFQYESTAEVVAALNIGKIDAFVSDRIVGTFYLNKSGGKKIEMRGDFLFTEDCAIAARKDSVDLVYDVNQALLSVVQDGTYAKFYKRWAGSEPNIKALLASWAKYTQDIPKRGEGLSDKPKFADDLDTMLPILAKGAWLTIKLSLYSALAALLPIILLALALISKNTYLRSLADSYVRLIRGTPLLVQLFISYFLLATLLNDYIFGGEIVTAFYAGIIALTANTTSYNAETLRGGINAVDKGQWDAAASLGMKRQTIMRRIILPQALRNSLPSLGNNFIVLIKDTSLVGAITLLELTYQARNITSQSGQAFMPWILAAAFYLVIIEILTLGLRNWEKYLMRSKQAVGSTV